MREAIGGSWLFGLVITFIVFFASFLAISINYSKAFNVKNNMVDLISKYEGNNKCARDQIGSYLQSVGYLVRGKCPSDYIGYNQNGESTYDKAFYCIKKIEANSNNIDKKYYSVIIFFKIDLPVVGDITTFKIKGETESIYFANESNMCI